MNGASELYIRCERVYDFLPRTWKSHVILGPGLMIQAQFRLLSQNGILANETRILVSSCHWLKSTQKAKNLYVQEMTKRLCGINLKWPREKQRQALKSPGSHMN